MSRNQNNNTIKEHFNNNGRGFDSPYVVNIPEVNIKVEVYSHNLKANKIGQIKSDIEEAVKNFKNLSDLGQGGSEKTLKIYIFDNKDDYSHLGNEFGLGLGDEGGKAYYRGGEGKDAFAEMYVYQAGGVHNFKHELAHGLTYIATGGKELLTVLMEGIADYIEHNSDQNFNTQEGFSIDEAEIAIGKRGLDLNSILKLQYSEDAANNSLTYKMGHALIVYLKDKGILEDYLGAIKKGDSDYAESLIHRHYNQKDFTDWLSQHNTETAMKEMNALQVTKGEFIATKKEIIDGEIKDVSYYKANIEKIGGENVGQFSTTSHYFTSGYFRVKDSPTGYCLDISKQYNFIKVVNHKGEKTLAYCDERGNEYKDSDDYAHLISRYSGTKKGDIIEGLTYFDPSQVRTTGHQPIEHFQIGKIYSVQSNGANAAKQINGISIYDGSNKVGELLAESGFFANVEGSDKDTFTFVDNLMGLHTKYDNGAYVAVTEENGGFKASLIDGRSVSKDEYYNQPHSHRSELLEPSINHLNKDKIDDSLLFKGPEFLDHSESEVAKIPTRVKRGELLDDKGTDRTEDDVYEAKIEKTDQDSFMYTFQNKGFYLNTEGDFFIHNHGTNERFQLPKEITHLKLVEKDGVKKLVPVTKDGNENPYGMPSNMPDEYRYIDPIFAHEYEKKDYSHKHVNVGLINFDNYKPDTMFSMRYDPNDYQISKDVKGDVIKLNNQSHFTKVKLFDENDEDIGMLSNNFHNYTGKIFFSVDYNYSYNDFLASISPQVNIEQLQNGTKVITFDQGKGDIGGTDRGYTDYQRIHAKGNQEQKQNDYRSDEEEMQGDQAAAYYPQAALTQSNNDRDHNVQYDKGQSGSRGKRTIDESDNSHKENTIKSVDQSSAQKPIVLNFEIERGEAINQYQFSARIKLTEDSKNLLLDALGDDVQFDNLDGYFDLDPKNFYIQSGYGNRDELLAKDAAGNVFVSNLPLNYYGFSVEVSSDGSSIVDSGFYPLSVMHHPSHYNKAQHKYSNGHSDNGELLSITTKSVLGNLLSNTHTSTTKNASAYMHDEAAKENILAQVSNKITAKEKKAAEEKRQVEEELSKKSQELKELVDKGEIVIFKVVEGSNINNKDSTTVLQLTEKSKEALGVGNKDVTLDSREFYITELKAKKDGDPHAGKYLYSVKEEINLGYDNLFYVLSKSGSSDVKDGFYYLDEGKFDSLATYLEPKHKCYTVDNKSHEKLIASLKQQDTPATTKQSVVKEQMQSDQPVVDSQKTHKQHNNNHDKQFNTKNGELKEAIKEGDIIIYRVEENSHSDDEDSSVTFKMTKKSQKALKLSNEDNKSIELDLSQFDIGRIGAPKDVDAVNNKLFYVLDTNDPSNSGFYYLGKDKFKFPAKYLDDPQYKCNYQDNLDDKLRPSLKLDDHKDPISNNEAMQSDQPQKEKASSSAEQKEVVLKDTILTISKSDTPDEHGRYKAEIIIKFSDINSLYSNASSKEEQEYVLNFYHNKLGGSYRSENEDFKIGDLSEKQFYFDKKGNFIIHDEQGKPVICPKENISLKLMHLNDHQGNDHLELVVLSKTSDKEVVGYIHEINNLSYGLLTSDSDVLSHLETHRMQDDMRFVEHHNEYDTYLINGLEAYIFGHIH